MLLQGRATDRVPNARRTCARRGGARNLLFAVVIPATGVAVYSICFLFA